MSPRLSLILISALFFACRTPSQNEPQNQGAIFQHGSGQFSAQLTNRGWATNPRITDTSAVIFYLLKNEKLVGIAFTNEPGVFGFDGDSNFYYPPLEAMAGENYSGSKPKDPVAQGDADTWQCIRNPYSSSAQYGKFQCGVNESPIRYLDRSRTAHTLAVHAANSRGYAQWSGVGFSAMGSAFAPVKEGEKYSGFFAVYYSAVRTATDAEDRFDLGSSIWKRPIEPDLISPRVNITVKLAPEGARDAGGSTYDIPDFSTWYDGYASCRATQTVPAGSIYISEILWMGSKDLSGISSSEDEFIEIYNSNSFDVNISSWRLSGAGAGSAALSFPICTTIKAGSVFTIAATTAKAISQADYVTGALSLSNSGETSLAISDTLGNVVSTLSGCTTGPWGGQGVNGATGNAQRSMRLTNIATPASTCAAGWTSTSAADATYALGSQKIATGYRASNDLGSEGTVATPGFKGP